MLPDEAWQEHQGEATSEHPGAAEELLVHLGAEGQIYLFTSLVLLLEPVTGGK